MLSKKWTSSGEEPSLKEMLDDPIVGLIMARDNLRAKDVLHVMHSTKARLDLPSQNAA